MDLMGATPMSITTKIGATAIIALLAGYALTWLVLVKPRDMDISRLSKSIAEKEEAAKDLERTNTALEKEIGDLTKEIETLKPDLDGFLEELTRKEKYSLWISGADLIEFRPERQTLIREDNLEKTLEVEPTLAPDSGKINYRSPRGIPEAWGIQMQGDVLTVGKTNAIAARYTRLESPVEEIETKPIQEYKKRSIVSAEDDWAATDLRLFKGQNLSVTAKGRIFVTGDHSCSPEGCDEDKWREYSYMRSQPHGCLIARIGKSGKLIKIGNRQEFEAAESGELFFSVNDKHQRNNAGHFEVETTVQPKSLKVVAGTSWVPSGVYLETIYEVVIEASCEGAMNGSNSCNPDGYATSGRHGGENSQGFPLGALIGRIDGFNSPFLIGEGLTFQPYFRGELLLAVTASQERDDPPAFIVNISFARPPKPVTARRPRILVL